IEADLAHSFNILCNFLESYTQKEALTHLVVFGGYASIFFAPMLSKLFSLPLVTLIRGNDFDTGLFSPRRKEMVENCLLASSLVCSVSKDKILKISKLYPAIKVAYTPNGIDLEQWQALPNDLEQAKQWKERFPDKKIIGLFGHLKEKKGALFFLKQVLETKLEKEIHFLIIGEIQKELQEFLESKEELSYTHFAFVERYALLAFYPACDAIAIPSFYDGMPNVLLEAMALGVPIIAARVAGMADVLSEENSFLFQVADSETCRRSLRAFAKTDAKILKNMGEALKQLVENQYTQIQEAQRYKKLLLDLENTLLEKS
ncbi:MAG: glycosyltransferase family 4 protein, partial [Thermonemataceae bacterium]|nr:glycosyltransferase family 4 protein [Thermonemataceae bacterium]